MSIIIASKIENRVVVVGDSAESLEGSVDILTDKERLKVLRIGMCLSARQAASETYADS